MFARDILEPFGNFTISGKECGHTEIDTQHIDTNAHWHTCSALAESNNHISTRVSKMDGGGCCWRYRCDWNVTYNYLYVEKNSLRFKRIGCGGSEWIESNRNKTSRSGWGRIAIWIWMEGSVGGALQNRRTTGSLRAKRQTEFEASAANKLICFPRFPCSKKNNKNEIIAPPRRAFNLALLWRWLPGGRPIN